MHKILRMYKLIYYTNVYKFKKWSNELIGNQYHLVKLQWMVLENEKIKRLLWRFKEPTKIVHAADSVIYYYFISLYIYFVGEMT